ncbi:MAG: hypothetical protein BWY88_01284 [Synergistetes bacterium ADurb.Bin520]|nr:MAG: hypothetical protein BWY88_01284 [Synergistetes bacterium ADurb.Bin520]
MEFPDHGFELRHLAPQGVRRRVGPLGGEEADGAVAPVVLQILAGDGVFPGELELVELHDGKKLQTGDAQLLEVGDLLHHSQIGPGMLHPRMGTHGEAPHMGFVDDALPQRVIQRPVPLPVEIIVDDDALGHPGGVELGVEGKVPLRGVGVPAQGPVEPPAEIPRQRLGVGVQEDLVPVEAVAPFRVVGPVNPVLVEGAGSDPREKRVPDIPGAVQPGVEKNLLPGLPVLGTVEEEQRNRRGVTGENRELGSPRMRARPERQRLSGQHVPLHPKNLATAWMTNCGLSAWTQCPAPGTVTISARGKNLRASGRSSSRM